MRSADAGRIGRGWLLAAGDFVVFILFAVLGRTGHGSFSPNIPFLGPLATSAPFLLAWYAIAPFLGAYNPNHYSRPRLLTLRTIVAWLFAGPAGLILRALWLERPIPPSFAAIVLLGHLVLLFLWRLGFSWFGLSLDRERG